MAETSQSYNATSSATSFLKPSKSDTELSDRESPDDSVYSLENSTVYPEIIRLSTLRRDLDLPAWLQQHNITYFHIGPPYEVSWDLVINGGPYIPSLPYVCDNVTLHRIDPTEPTPNERVHCPQEALEKAEDRFLKNALYALRCGSWRARECYNLVAKKNGLATRLQAMMFCCDFQESPIEVKETFAQILLILCLNLLGNFDSFMAQELLQRDLEIWCYQILHQASQLHKLRLPHHLDIPQEQVRVQILLLLRELYSVSGGRRIHLPHWLITSPTFTPRDNMMLYGLTCGVQTATSQEFGIFDLHRSINTILRSRLFVKIMDSNRIQSGRRFSEVYKLGSHLENSLPIAHLKWHLPPQILQELGFEEMKHFQIFCTSIDRMVPSLRKSTDDILFLLAWSPYYTGQMHTVLNAWANSADGHRLYISLAQDICVSKPPIRVALILAALFSLLRLHSHCLSTTWPSAKDPFSGFLLLFEQKFMPSSNMESTLAHMIWSFVEVAWEILEEIESQQAVLQILGGAIAHSRDSSETSKAYWERRFTPPQSHYEALSAMPLIFDS